jgi:integrase
MAAIRFNIDRKKNTGYIFLIYYCAANDRLKYSLGEKIPAKDWDSKKNRVKPVHPSATSINSLLSELVTFIDRTRHEYKIRGERLTSTALRAALEARIYGHSDQLFKDYALRWLNEKNLKPATAKGYRNMISKIDGITPHLTFDNVNKKWRDQIIKAMQYHKQNYRHIILKKFKEVMQSAYLDGVHRNMYHQTAKFVPEQEKVDTIYLNMDDLNHIYNNLHKLPQNLKNAMVLFLIGAFTGQRYQTYSKINKDMIIIRGNIRMISVITEKTGQRVSIPVSDKLESLLSMNIRIYTNQKLNQYIKEAAELLQMKNAEKITSHTARRSFATNAVLAGMDISLIMKITGHATEKEFRKYVRMDDVLAASKSAGMIRIMQDQ